MGAEGAAELNPWHLVVRRESVGVVGLPRASISTQLLHGEESLLNLRASKELKLGLNHSKPVIDLKRLSCLGEDRRMSSRKLSVGG
jgi:hypothetical protein